MKNRTPDAGDILWFNVGHGAGNEQDGYGPALVLTGAEFNELTSRFIGLPITSNIHGWESEIPISGLAKPCVAMADRSPRFPWQGESGGTKARLRQPKNWKRRNLRLPAF